MNSEEFWIKLQEHESETFYTVKGLPFSYRIKGGELFVDRRSKSITKATIVKAFDRVQEQPKQITGPKKLNVFGAPYIWALFKNLGVLDNTTEKS